MMNNFQKIVSVLLVLITVLLCLIYVEMKHSNQMQESVIHHLYNSN
ncbi:hypothetical protein ABIE27_001414 [Paenibacillus sp. 4624]|jgi:hypothetical protein